MNIQQELEKLVNKYAFADSKDLFRIELERLVAIAEKEQMIKDQESTLKILQGGLNAKSKNKQ